MRFFILSLFILFININNIWARGGGPVPVPALTSKYVKEQSWYEAQGPVDEVFWFRDREQLTTVSGNSPTLLKGVKHPVHGVIPSVKNDAVYLLSESFLMPIPDDYRPLTVVDYEGERFRGVKKTETLEGTQFTAYVFYYTAEEMFFEEKCTTPAIQGLRNASSARGDYFYHPQKRAIYELTEYCFWRQVDNVPMVHGAHIQSVMYLGDKRVVIETDDGQIWRDGSQSHWVSDATGKPFVVDLEKFVWVTNLKNGGVALILPHEGETIRLFQESTISSPQQLAYSAKHRRLYFAGRIHECSPNGVHSIDLDL